MPHLHQPEAETARSLAEQAYYRLRELIVNLEFAPGSMLSERDLQERTGLGRTPIREALRTLESDRLVELFPRRGVIVANVNAGDLAGLSEVRLLLEPPAARLAAERADATDRAAIDELLAELASSNGDQRTLIELDQRIHRRVYHAAHNPRLERSLNEYYLHALRIWFLALDRASELGDAVRKHEELLLAIRDGDGAGAEAAMRDHISDFERTMRAIL